MVYVVIWNLEPLCKKKDKNVLKKISANYMRKQVWVGEEMEMGE